MARLAVSQFPATCLSIYPLKTSENQRISDALILFEGTFLTLVFYLNV